MPAEAAGLTAISVTRFPGFATPPRDGCAVYLPVWLYDTLFFGVAPRRLEQNVATIATRPEGARTNGYSPMSLKTEKIGI